MDSIDLPMGQLEKFFQNVHLLDRSTIKGERLPDKTPHILLNKNNMTDEVSLANAVTSCYFASLTCFKSIDMNRKVYAFCM